MLYVDWTDSNNTSILNSTNNGALKRESWEPFHCAFFFVDRGPNSRSEWQKYNETEVFRGMLYVLIIGIF